MKRALGLAAVLLAVLAPAARAADHAIATDFDHSGDPWVFLIRDSSDERVLQYRSCPPDGGPCQVLQPGSSGIMPGPTAAGTVFELDVEQGGSVDTVRTDPWKGRVDAVAPPAIAGEAKVGATVGVTPATWNGGWGRRTYRDRTVEDLSGSQVVACRAATGKDCMIFEPGPLSQHWAGWYLFATETRYAKPGCWENCSTVNDGLVPLPWPFPAIAPASATFAVSAPVQICCTLPAPAPDVIPAPMASVRAKAVRAKGRLLVGRVDCTVRCSVGLTVSGGGRKVYTRTFFLEGPAALSIPVRHGKLSVRVKVDGQELARGHVKAR